MTKRIYWHRITVTDLTGTEHTFMYPSVCKHFSVIEFMGALEDLDYAGYPATETYAGLSMIEADKDAGWWYYKMEG